MTRCREKMIYNGAKVEQKGHRQSQRFRPAKALNSRCSLLSEKVANMGSTWLSKWRPNSDKNQFRNPSNFDTSWNRSWAGFSSICGLKRAKLAPKSHPNSMLTLEGEFLQNNVDFPSYFDGPGGRSWEPKSSPNQSKNCVKN